MSRSAIYSSRSDDWEDLDFHPTPPMTVRHFLKHGLFRIVDGEPLRYADALGGDATDPLTAWDPAAGQGHMVAALRDVFRKVYASDIMDYGKGFAVHDFLSDQHVIFRPDWIVMNPPFAARVTPFILRALEIASEGVAAFVRVGFTESLERYDAFFGPAGLRPTLMAFIPERVPIFKGAYSPDDTPKPIQYAWMVWRYRPGTRELMPPVPDIWLPPGQRESLRLSDAAIGERLIPKPRRKEKKRRRKSRQRGGADARI
jgi:hypothetical protein